MASLLELPNDMVKEICDRIDIESLTSLMRTSKTFHDVIEKLGYPIAELENLYQMLFMSDNKENSWYPNIEYENISITITNTHIDVYHNCGPYNQDIHLLEPLVTNVEELNYKDYDWPEHEEEYTYPCRYWSIPIGDENTKWQLVAYFFRNKIPLDYQIQNEIYQDIFEQRDYANDQWD